MKNHYTYYVPEPREYCDAHVAAGIGHFFEKLVAPATADSAERMLLTSFSLTSRKFSIWSRLRDHLQSPLDDVIRQHRGGPWAEQLLTDFDLASLGRTPPRFRIDEKALTKAEALGGGAYDLDHLVVPTQEPINSTQRKRVATADTAIHNVNAWAQNMRFVIRSLDWSLPGSMEVLEKERFRATIESIFTLLLFLPVFRPKKSSDPLNDQEGAYPQILDGKTRIQSGWLCELCWRPTMRATTMREPRSVPSMNARVRSDRFCFEHNPSDPSSRYRVDIRYKSAFQKEIIRFLNSSLKVLMLPPESRNILEARKTAYDRVHARIRPLTQSNKLSFREEVWQRHERGMRQTEIAQELGTSRQSVFRSVKGTKTLLEIQKNHRDLNDETWECWEKSTNSDLVKVVAELHGSGSTVAEIARITGHFKPTISSVLRWLSEQSTPTQS